MVAQIIVWIIYFFLKIVIIFLVGLISKFISYFKLTFFPLFLTYSSVYSSLPIPIPSIMSNHHQNFI